MLLGALVSVLAAGLVGFAIVRFEYALILVLLILGVCLFLLISPIRGSVSSKKTHRRNTSGSFLVISLGLLLLLNLLAFTKGQFLQQALATAVVLLAIYPTWRYLKDRERNVPIFPFVALAFGLHYGVVFLLPIEVDPVFGNVSEESITKALILSTLGLSTLLLTFYIWRLNFLAPLIPRIPDAWAEKGAPAFGVLLGIIGLLTNASRHLLILPISPDIPESVFNFGIFVGYAGISVLFLLLLRGRLSVEYKVFLWLIILLNVPFLLGFGGAAGAFLFGSILFFLYVAETRKIPWAALGVGVAVVSLLVATRAEIRSTIDTAPSRLGRVQTSIAHLQLAASVLTEQNLQRLGERFQGVGQRVDFLTRFAYVVELTPSDIPYWQGETYKNLLWKFIPRIVYPSKPEDVVAQEFPLRYRLFGGGVPDKTVPLPLLLELYANFGPLFVVVGMFLLGLVIRVLYHVTNYTGVRGWALICAVVIGASLFDLGANFSILFGGLFLKLLALALVGVFVRVPRIRTLPQAGRVRTSQ